MRSESNKKKQYYQVSFLPWADIREEFQIGPINFWHFSDADKKINDKDILNHLKEYFKSYVDYQGNPVETIVICSYENKNFKPLTNNEYNNLKSVVNALIFSVIAPAVKNAVCANNRSMGPPSAEIYELIYQNFNLGNKIIAVQAGSTKHIWELGQVKFSQPWASGGFLRSPDKELIRGFSNLYNKNIPQETRERIFRSLEWFRFAHVENDLVSSLSKLVMMATAFEILLQVPNIPNKKKFIAEKLEKQVISSKLIRQSRRDSKGNTYNKLGWWAWDFYDLRNKIVHGDHIPLKLLKYKMPTKQWISHYIVSDLIFLECVKRELFGLGCIGDSARECARKFDEAFPNDHEPQSTLHMAEWFLGFNDVYRSLGWVRKRRK